MLRSQEQLAHLEEAVDVALADDELVHQIEKLRPPKGSIKCPDSISITSNRQRFLCETAYTTSQTFVDEALSGLASFQRRFFNLTHPLLQLHGKIDALVLERSPHTKAYHAGLGAIFRAEKDAAANENRPLGDEQALRIARLQICMAPQTSDTSFSLRAMWCVTIAVMAACLEEGHR